MKILLLGKNGQVGWELQRALPPLGELLACDRTEANLENIDAVCALINQYQPQVIVNAAAHTAVDKAESEPDRAHAINALAVGRLAAEAANNSAWLVHYSTDYVFDGEKPTPFREDDLTNPLSAYGRTKREGERLIQASGARHLIFRTSWVYATRGRNFAKTMLRLAKERDTLSVVADQHGAPTSAELIADVTALALYHIRQTATADDLAGIYHLAAGGSTTWHGYAQHVLALARKEGIAIRPSHDQIRPIPTEAYPLPAARPRNSLLDTSKFRSTFDLQMPDWQYHVQRMVSELAAQGTL